MTKKKTFSSSHLLRAASLTALSFAAQLGVVSYAHAQTPAATGVEEVIVTGSRIQRPGLTAPTPVTSVAAEELVQVRTLVSEALESLPNVQVGNQRTAGPGTGGNGNAAVQLRSLGAGRTLVLLDGRRFLPSSGAGSVDTSLLPNNVLQRVDVVTGGASAAYGADAVAGVVNYILDKNFSGQKLGLEYGLSWLGDTPRGQIQYAAGGRVLNDRAHIIFSAEAYRSDGIRVKDRPFYTDGSNNLIVNPCPAGTAVSANCPKEYIGGPLQYRTTDVRQINGNPGGLISNTALRGLTFNPDGTTRLFNYGILAGTQFAMGGEGDSCPSGDSGCFPTAVGDLVRANNFIRFSYDVNENLTVFVENLIGWTANTSHGGYAYALGSTALPIRRDNAFLPQAIRDRMVALNLQTFNLGRQLVEWPRYTIHTRVGTWRTLVGGDYKLNDKWNVNVFAVHGENRRSHVLPGNLDQIALFRAVDAVVVPSTNTPAGLQPGAIVCRSTLTNPTDKCVPVNPFGVGNVSPAGIAYSSTNDTHSPWSLTNYSQDIVSFAASGEVFEGWGAGPVSVAFGGEGRWEDLKQVSDEYSQIFNPVTNTFGGWRAGNQLPFAGKVNVKEAFVEASIPLVKDMPFAEAAELNAAGRVTDYSTSGTVYTWKIGLTYSPIEDLRLRFTRSRDIRAPTMNDLFLAGTAGTGNIRDPFTNTTVAGVKTVTTGNPDLKPEVAKTTVLGAVYQPSWLSGASFSVDAYRIEISDAIGSLSSANIMNQCFLNPASTTCSFIVRTNGILSAINNKPFNFSFANTEGLDYEFALRKPIYSWMPVIGDGTMQLRLLATNVLHNRTQAPGEVVNENAGEIGRPKWLAVASMQVVKGPWRTYLQSNYIHKVVFDRAWVVGKDINDNTIGSVVYWDGRISYDLDAFGGDARISLGVNNIFDRKPPSGQGGSGEYDEIGRAFRIGLDLKY